MTQSDTTEAMLERLFSQARAADGHSGNIPSALMARVMADADMALAERAALGASDERRVLPARGWRAAWRGFVATIGGPRALGGLTAAALTGIWIGAVSGSDVASYLGVGAVTGASVTQGLETVELMPGEELFAMVGGIGG